MPTAVCVIRPLPEFRVGSFVAGLKRCGYSVASEPARDPKPDELLVVWNRSSVNGKFAQRYEQAGATVLVAENGYLGREWRDGYWYAIARSHHNGGGAWPDLGPARWDGWGLELAPWRSGGREIVVLAQRGIGEDGYRQPRGWHDEIARTLASRTSRPVRIRPHPGRLPEPISLADDLRSAWACVTWGSAAALKALMLGVPVFYGCPTWIGRTAARPVSDDLEAPFLGDRLPMFRRLAWAMYNTEEIATGEPFRCLLRL